MTKVKVFTRPTVGGKRKWAKVNLKKVHEEGTVFYLRWLPKGASNYMVESLGAIGLAGAQLKRAAKEIELLRDADAPEQLNRPLTLPELRVAFLQDRKTTFKKDGSPMGRDALRQYERVTEGFLGTVKRTRPREITKQDLKTWLAAQRERHAHGSVCTFYTLVASFLRFCGVDHKALLPQRERPAPVAKTPEAYTEQEMAKFFFAIVNERDALAFEFLLKTGSRKMEMATLDWTNLQLGDNPTVTFRTKQGFRTKSGKARTVPLEGRLSAKLAAWHGKNPESSLVFPTPKGKPERGFQRICVTVAKRAGMDPENFWPHKFRDTFATWSLRRGADIRTVQHWLGHSSISMTERYLAPEQGEQAQNQINKTFGGTVADGMSADPFLL